MLIYSKPHNQLKKVPKAPLLNLATTVLPEEFAGVDYVFINNDSSNA